MPTLDSDDALPFVKIMLIGDSGAGKTGSLVSLVEAGYYLHFIDLDGGLSFLANYLRKNNPKLLSHIDFVPIRDKYKKGEFVRPAKAYLKATRLLDKWECPSSPWDGSAPAEWGEEHVLVVDSLTNLGIAALNQAHTLKPGSSSGKAADGRQIYGMAQEAMQGFVYATLEPDFQTNVIFCTHITEIELGDGMIRGFPTTVGKAYSKNVAKDFNDLFIVERNVSGKRVIRTIPNPQTDAKTSALDLPKELPIETGMAQIFKAIRGV